MLTSVCVLLLPPSLYPKKKTDMPKKDLATNIFFGTELPTIQAPMAGVKGSSLGISVPFVF